MYNHQELSQQGNAVNSGATGSGETHQPGRVPAGSQEISQGVPADDQLCKKQRQHAQRLLREDTFSVFCATLITRGGNYSML